MREAMRSTTILMTTAAAIAALTLGACAKKDAGGAGPSGSGAATSAPAATGQAAAAGATPFLGTYTKYAEAAWKNGKRTRVTNSSGTATLTVEAAKVTYDQTYTAGGKSRRVVQTYSYAPTAVKPLAGGHYDVALTFLEMTGDTQSYSPDKNRPKLEARKQAGGWEIGLITTDDQGVMGGVEFK